MSMPSGWTIQTGAIRAMFGPGGANPSCHIDYTILDANGNNVGGGTHSLYQTGPQATDQFVTDGKTTAFTTTQAPFGGEDPTVTLGGQPITSGVTFAANANGTITATFATAPAAATGTQPNLQLTYPTGPSLTNSAGDLVSALGLTGGTGTVYTGGGGKLLTAHSKVVDLAALLLEWAQTRVVGDKF
jgi:hypothetical protein